MHVSLQNVGGKKNVMNKNIKVSNNSFVIKINAIRMTITDMIYCGITLVRFYLIDTPF